MVAHVHPGSPDRVFQNPSFRPAGRRIRKVSLDSTLSGRPELHCEAHVSSPSPRSLQSERTGIPALADDERPRL